MPDRDRCFSLWRSSLRDVGIMSRFAGRWTSRTRMRMSWQRAPVAAMASTIAKKSPPHPCSSSTSPDRPSRTLIWPSLSGLVLASDFNSFVVVRIAEFEPVFYWFPGSRGLRFRRRFS